MKHSRIMGGKMYKNGNGMIRYFAITSIVCVVLVGCKPTSQADNQPESERGKGQSTLHSAPTSAPSPPTQPFATAEQWSKAVSQVFDKINIKKLRDKKNPAYVEDDGKTDKNGVTSFIACFDKAPPKCELIASGTRDGFRKIQFFMDPILEYMAHDFYKPTIGAYVALKDCSPPTIFLQPTFRASDWIFLEHFGLMLDGAIVIERKFNLGQVERNNTHTAVSESVDILLSEQEVNALRKISEAKQVLIRLTGQKGYVGIDEARTSAFVQGVARLLRMHHALGQAVENLGPVKDTACPL
jgi:hypothetical protein